MHLVASTRTEFQTMAMNPPIAVQPAYGGILRKVVNVIVKLAGGEWVGSRRADKRRMRVVETLAIGAKKQLALVCCDNELFLIGMGTDSVQTIVRVGPETAKNQASTVAAGAGERL